MNYTLGEVFAIAFLQGFKASGEGYNGDYPFNYDEARIIENKGFQEALEKALQDFENKVYLTVSTNSTSTKN